MTTRRIILIALILLIAVGLGNFIWNSTQTRSQLALVSSKDTTKQEEGVRLLMQRGVLFDALQGGAPPETRLAAIAALARLSKGGKNPATFKELLQMLKDPDTESAAAKTHPVRDAAKDAVASVGTDYPDILLDAAKDSDGNIRDQSRNALRQIGVPLQEKMAARLGDSALRAPFGDILSSLGNQTIPLIAPYLKPPLLKLEDKPDDLAKAKVELIEIMGKFKVADAARPVLPLKDDPDPTVRRAVITALANIADPVGAPVLIEALNNPNADASARAAAAGALGGIATPAANAAMAKALSDYDTSVAVAAAAGLRRAGDSATPYIAQALGSSDVSVRARAAVAAGGLRSTNLAVRALGDKDATVRAQAALSLGEILSHAAAIRSDLSHLTTTRDPKADASTIRNLQTEGGFLELLHPTTSPAARANAIAALQAQSDAETKPDAKKPFDAAIVQLNDAKARLAESKLPPLAAINDTTIAPLVTALTEREDMVGANASLALQRVGKPAVTPLSRLLSNPNDTIAYHAAETLRGIGAVAVPTLLGMAQPGKAGARWAAVTLGEIGDPKAIPALQNLATTPDSDTAYAATAALAKVKAG